jgi:hypothetical protein
MNQGTTGSQHHNVLTSENDSAEVQTKIAFNVRGQTYNEDLLQHNPNPSAPPPIHDLSKTVKGMYRILDLISEQGSGGLGKMHAPDLCLRNQFLCQLTRSLSLKTHCGNL